MQQTDVCMQSSMSSLTTVLQKASEPIWSSGPKGWFRFTSKLSTQPRRVHVVLLLMLVTVIGWTDYVTGWEVSFSVIYAIPVLITAWLLGLRYAIIMAIGCGPVWWLANIDANPYQTTWGYTWAATSGVIYRIFVAIAGSAIRLKLQADAEQIRMLKEMRQMEKELITVAEHEQQRIGQDLHDGLCQQLAAIGCATRALADDLRARAVPESMDAERIEEAIQQTVVEARSLARGIFPVHVDRSGLSAALEELAIRTSELTGIRIDVSETAEVQVDDPEVAMHLFRIVQEAVSNAVRHSGARHIIITLNATYHLLELRVDDDGVGFDSNDIANTAGMGLRTMRYRAQSIGAHFSIQRCPEGGTSTVCQLRVKTLPSPHLNAN